MTHYDYILAAKLIGFVLLATAILFGWAYWYLGQETQDYDDERIFDV